MSVTFLSVVIWNEVPGVTVAPVVTLWAEETLVGRDAHHHTQLPH